MLFSKLFKAKEEAIEIEDFSRLLSEKEIPQDLINEALHIIKLIMIEVGEEKILNNTIKKVKDWETTELLTEAEWKEIYNGCQAGIENQFNRLLREIDMSFEEQTEYIDHFHPNAKKSVYVMTHIIAEGINNYSPFKTFWQR